MRLMRFRVKIFFFALFIFIPSFSFADSGFYFTKHVLVGKKAPDFTLPMIGKGELSFLQNRGNQKTILFFWATWCPNCKEQLFQLNKDQQELAKNKIKIVTVDVMEIERPVAAYLKKENINFDVFLDKKNALKDIYDSTDIPLAVFINEEGIVTAFEHDMPKPGNIPDYGPVVVPENNFFALGDNRVDSIDSRTWGPVPYSCLKGGVKLVWLSLNERGSIRENRIGTLVR